MWEASHVNGGLDQLLLAAGGSMVCLTFLCVRPNLGVRGVDSVWHAAPLSFVAHSEAARSGTEARQVQVVSDVRVLESARAASV